MVTGRRRGAKTRWERDELRLAFRLASPLLGQGIPTAETLPWLLALVKLLLAEGWIPPPLTKAEGGRKSAEIRRGFRIIRRAAVGAIMNDAPDQYRDHPRSIRTREWVREELKHQAPLLPPYSDSTLEQDIQDWAYG
jgi:hypothetical protein